MVSKVRIMTSIGIKLIKLLQLYSLCFGCILVLIGIRDNLLLLFTPQFICQKVRWTWMSVNSKELKNVNLHKKYCTFQKSLRKLIGLAVIPNMEIYMKWTNHLAGGFFESGSRRLADKNWEYKWGLKECLSSSRDAWRGGPFLCELPCLGIEVGNSLHC